MAVRFVSLVILQHVLIPTVLATRYASLIATETKGTDSQNIHPIPHPTPTAAPQLFHQFDKRDDATCGYYDNGAANVCNANSYCYTSVTADTWGVWQCCEIGNPNCYTSGACTNFVNCVNDVPYCNPSYIYNSPTLYTRWGCGSSSDPPLFMDWNYEDTPGYTSSLEAQASAAAQSSADAIASSLSAAAAASESQAQAAAASQSQAEAEAASQSLASALAEASSESAAAAASESAAEASSEAAAQASSKAAALASSLSVEKASLSKVRLSTTQVTVVVTDAQGHASTSIALVATQIPEPKKEGLSKGALAGVVVGSIVGALLLGAGAVVLFLIHKKRKEDIADGDDNVPYITGAEVAEPKGPATYYPPPSSSQSPAWSNTSPIPVDSLNRPHY